MSKCYTFNKVTLTQEELVQNILNQIDKPGMEQIKSTILSIQSDYITKLNRLNSVAVRQSSKDPNINNRYIGVSEYLEFEHDLGQVDAAGRVILRPLVPIYNKENRIENTLNNLLQAEDTERANGNVQEALANLLQQIEEESAVSEFGSLFHNLLSVAFKSNTATKKGYESVEFINALSEAKKTIEESVEHEVDGQMVASLDTILTSRERGSKPNIDEIMRIIKKNVITVVDSILNNPDYAGATILSEHHISTPSVKIPNDNFSGIKGICDLIIVKPNGDIDIIDFKVSTRSYDDWYSAKKIHTQYQLGMYRAILAANGFDGYKISLYTLPINMPMGAIRSMRVETKRNLGISSGSTPSKLDYTYGDYSNNIRQLIYSEIPTQTINTSELGDEVDEALRKLIVPFERKERNYTFEELEKRITSQVFNGRTYYFLTNPLTGKRERKNSKEEFTEVINKIIEETKSHFNRQVKTITQQIQEYQSNGTHQASFDFLGSKANPDTNVYNVLQQTFGKYVNKKYKRLNIDALLDLGIIAYEDIRSGIIDFICMTDQKLGVEQDNNGSQSVLGKFYNNDQVRRLVGIDVMDSKTENMEYIKLMTVLNVIAEKNPNIFRNKKIGLIKVINNYEGQSDVPRVNQLRSNFDYLIKTANSKGENITNHFTQDIVLADTWQMLISELDTILNNVKDDQNLHDMLSSVPTSNLEKNQKIEKIEELMKKLRRDYPQELKHATITEARSFTTPVSQAYYLLANALLYYRNAQVQFNGKLSTWGLNVTDIFRLIGGAFVENQNSFAGPLQGLISTTPSASPSQNMENIALFYRAAYDKLREEFFKQANNVNRLCLDYMKTRWNKTQLERLAWNDTYKIWESLMVKDSEGDLSNNLLLKNPYSETNMDPRDRQFLKEILWEINKWRIPRLDLKYQTMSYKGHEAEIDNLEQVRLYQASEKYFELPLRRGSDFNRMRNIGHIGWMNFFNKAWQNLRDDFDLRGVHADVSAEIDRQLGEDSIQMYNAYDITDKARQGWIDKEGKHDFEINLNFLAADMAYQSIRKRYFDEVLLHVEAVATVMHYYRASGGATFAEELDAIDKQINISIKDKTILPKEVQGAAKAMSAAKKLNSYLVLSLRPLSFLKEITFGTFNGCARVWAMKGTSQEFSMNDLVKAAGFVFGQSGKKYLNVVGGNGDIADFSLCEQINIMYGIVNQDISSIVEKQTLNKTGLVNQFSNYMFINSIAPDYYNRMCLFIAKMIHDGVLEAHSFNEEGVLTYDFTKDKRFATLNRIGLNANSTDAKYLEEKALYRAMADEFTQNGYQMTSADGKLLPLPRAYTNRQAASLKEFSDSVYGYYDHETKSLIDHMAIGLIWKQFMAFWTAKFSLWFKGKPKSAGQSTSQGKYVPLVIDGKTQYRKIIELANGELQVQLVDDNEGGTLEPQYVWQGDYIEGIFASITSTIRDLYHLNFSEIINNKQRLANLKLAMHDILVGLLLWYILKLIFSGGTGKMSDMNPFERTLVRALDDVGPHALTGLSWEPGFYTNLVNLKNDFLVLLDDDKEADLQDWMEKRVGAIRDWNWGD